MGKLHDKGIRARCSQLADTVEGKVRQTKVMAVSYTHLDVYKRQVRYDDRLLLKSLIASSPVPIRAVEELPLSLIHI